MACGVLSAAVYPIVYRLPSLHPLGELRNLLATLAASLPFAVALRLVYARSRVTIAPRHLALLLVGSACLLRLGPPLERVEGSSDAYRYLWDGRVIADGINPYLHPPRASELAHLRDDAIYPHIFRPQMRTVYPPLAELWFFAAHALSPRGFAGLKLVLLAHELATVLLLLALLRRSELPPLRALAYAWSPLAVVQLSAAGHLDGLALPWLVLGLLWAERRPLAAGAALGGASLVRPLHLLLLPALASRRPAREGARAIAACLGVVALGWLPFVGAGRRLVESLTIYGLTWRFNGSLFLGLERLLGERVGVRAIGYGLCAGGSFVVGILPLELRTRWLLALALYLLLAPTVYPWYLLPVALLAAPTLGLLAATLPFLITLSDMVFVHSLFTGEWAVPSHVHALEYAGLALVALAEAARPSARRRASAA
jgi:hypothetical protein